MALHPAILGALKGECILWGAPTADQTGIGWEECKHALNGAIKPHESFPHRVEFPSGGKIVFETLDDPDNARGFTWHGVVLDEASLIKPAAWYEVIMPILGDTGGWALLIFTPKGKNWIYQEWIKAKELADSAAWQIPTLGVKIAETGLIREPHPLENPDFSFDEAVKLYQSLPQRIFEQEFLAQFVEGEGQVFRKVREACVLEKPDTPSRHQGHHIVAGLDWGKLNDYTRIRVGCMECRWAVDWDGFNQIDYHFQRDKLKVLFDKWKIDDILAEHNAIGDPNIEELQREGFPVRAFETTAVSKPPLIESLALALEREEIKLPKEDTDELEAYEMKTNANTGRPSYSAPEGLHDDRVMADALMLQAMIEPWYVGTPKEAVIAAQPSRWHISTNVERGNSRWRH